jgi:hypothetical protein
MPRKVHELKFELKPIAAAGTAQFGIDVKDLIGSGPAKGRQQLVRVHSVTIDDNNFWSTFAALEGSYQGDQAIDYWLTNRALTAAELPGGEVATSLTAGNSSIVDTWERQVTLKTYTGVGEQFTWPPADSPWTHFCGWKGSGVLFLSTRMVFGIANYTGLPYPGTNANLGVKIIYSVEDMSDSDLLTLLASQQETPVFADPAT